jgi:hypothetical protein
MLRQQSAGSASVRWSIDDNTQGEDVMLRKSQEGLSAITVMLLVPLVGLLVLVVIKLIPVYLEYQAVKKVLHTMTSDRVESYRSANEVRGTILKRFGINDVKNATDENITIEREGAAYVIYIDYEVQQPLFYNISLLISFSDKGEVPAS